MHMRFCKWLGTGGERRVIFIRGLETHETVVIEAVTLIPPG
jgi:hypothetical protein